MRPRRLSPLKFIFPILLVFTLTGLVGAEDKETSKMTIGSKAPGIDVEHWLSDAEGTFEKTTELASGQVYVIEFWATWCGPCIVEMPHIAKLQKKHGKAVQIISISDEDLETVEEFLERKVRGKKDMTYGELTSAYCLTTDPDRSVMDDYFTAAGQDGIPCAFLVGKTGLVEWIGHPASLEKPLQQVIDDKWDREKYLVEFQKEQQRREEQRKAARKMQKIAVKLQKLFEDGDNEKIVELLDKYIADEEYKIAWSQLKMMKLQTLVSQNMDGADKALDQFVTDSSDDSFSLNSMAWFVYEQHQGGVELSDSLLKSACNCAKVAAQAEPENGMVLDTYAHLIYASQKDLDKAIEVQKKAVKNAGPDVEEIKTYLDELLKEKEKQEKGDSEEEKKEQDKK